MSRDRFWRQNHGKPGKRHFGRKGNGIDAPSTKGLAAYSSSIDGSDWKDNEAFRRRRAERSERRKSPRELRSFERAEREKKMGDHRRRRNYPPEQEHVLSEDEVDAAMAPLTALLSVTSDCKTLPPWSTARQVAEAADVLVGKLAVQKHAWLPTAATRLRKITKDAALLHAAAKWEDTGIHGHSTDHDQIKQRERLLQLRRRLLVAVVLPEAMLKSASAPNNAPTRVSGKKAPNITALLATDLKHARQTVSRHVGHAGSMPFISLHNAPGWIDDVAGLEHVRAALSHAPLVGVDTEWADQPGERCGLATVQLAVGAGKTEKTFVLDSRFEVTAEYKQALHGLLEDLFCSNATRMVGFSFHGDGVKLAKRMQTSQSPLEKAQLEDIFCQRVIDIQQLAIQQGLGSVGQMPSLRSCCESWLGETHDKTEQCSDWALRPLKKSQIEYAALDACACLRILDAMGRQLGRIASIT